MNQVMKQVFVFAVMIAAVSFSGSAQIVKFFEKYADTDGVASVHITKCMLNLIPDMKTDNLDMSGMAGKIDCIRVLSTSQDEMASKLSADASKMIGKEKCELLFKVNEESEETVIYLRQGANEVNEYMIVNEEPSQFNAILIRGKITPEDIRKMTGNKKQE